MTGPRILAGLSTVMVLALALWGGERTGNYFGLVLMAAAAGMFWTLEFEAQRGTPLYAIQYLLVRFVRALVVGGIGATSIYFAVSELGGSPVVFDRAGIDALASVVRALVGSGGLSIIFAAIGIGFVLKGMRMFPSGRARSSPRENS